MLEIFVSSYNGHPPPTALKRAFGPDGGTLGRGVDNHLALPDPARHVSRVQARIRSDGNRFLIANVSDANPLFLNEEEIESGTERPLAAGDEIRIGMYLLGVRESTSPGERVDQAAPGAPRSGPMIGGPLDPLAGLGGTAAGLDPFADLLGPSANVPSPVPGGRPPISPPPDTGYPLDCSAKPPPMRVAPTPVPPATDPFADLMRPATPAMPPPGASMAPRTAPSERPMASIIPEDFNPFALPSSAPRNTDDPLGDLARTPIDLNAVDANAQRSSLVDFELVPKPGPHDELQGGTPSLLDSQVVVDPLRLFGGAGDDVLGGGIPDPAGHGPPMADNLPEIGAHFVPPRSVPEIPARTTPESGPAKMSEPISQGLPPPGVGPASPQTSGRHGGARPAHHGMASTSNGLGQRAPPVPAIERLSADASASLPTASASLDHAAASGTGAVSSRAVAASVGTTPDGDALLAAFLKGAHVTSLCTPGSVTPQLMEVMGALVYQAAAGAMELIAARQIAKREFRAEVTMLAADGNNPLKCLPTPEAAIMQMLGPRMPGFMTSGKAMQDAFDDLRAHEVGMIAGMRAALAEVLRRFDPAILEKRLGSGGLLDSLMPAARRSKLWNLYEARFHELYREANDDFQSLFGQAFIDAYMEQVNQERARRKRT